MLLIIVMGLGVVVGVSGSFALTSNVRHWRPIRWNRAHVAILVTHFIGIALALGSLFVVYPYGPKTRIIGFPLPAAAFEKHGELWLDFSGPLTLPFSCANAWFGFVAPHVILWTARKIAQRRERGSSRS
ncbi:MAG: hypothetical protein QM784_09130 [Polyangiaceae bacterium]